MHEFDAGSAILYKGNWYNENGPGSAEFVKADLHVMVILLA